MEGSSESAAEHPIVDRTLAMFTKAKPSDIGTIAVDGAGLIKCVVASQSIDCLAVILPRIVRAASLQGYELVGVEGPAHFKSETETIGFLVSETVR